MTAISQGFADLLEKLDLESFAGTNLLQQIDRQTFIDLIDERTNLSTSDAEQIVEGLENDWQQAVERYEKRDLNGELLNFLQSANPEELQFEQLVKKLEQLVGKDENTSVDSDWRSHLDAEVEASNNFSFDINQWNTLNPKAIKNALLKRVDLSEVEFEDVWHNLQSLYHQFNSSEEGLKLPFNTIRNDVEDYLWHAPPWYLNCEKGWQEFKEIIYDPQADPIQVRSGLEQVQPEDLVELLQQRDLDSDKIDEIAEHLAAVRQEVFDSIERAELQQQQQELGDRLKDYLQKVELTELQDDNLSSRIEQLLIESGVSTEVLTQFLSSWQELDWQTWLQQRQDLEPEKLKQTAEQLESIGDRLLEKVEDWQVQIASTAKELQDKLESYLRYTHLKHLTPEKIDTKLEQLWQEAVDNLPEMQQQLPEIDRSGLVEVLQRRKGLDVEQVEAIAEQIENWQESNGTSTPERSQLQAQSAQLSEKLVDYLYRAIEQNLNQADIEADLLPLLNLAQGKTTTIVNQQLAQLNWNEIEAQLKQVQKYSEIQIQQAIQRAREATRKPIGLPRRWATRTSQQVRDVIDELEDFLSYSNTIEFTSEHLEPNLKSIFDRSKTQLGSERDSTASNLDRLAKLTPANVTKSLSNRQDIAPDEVAQISDRFMAITHQLSEEISTNQERTNELIQNLLDRIGEYLSSLNLFHLDYDKIKDDLASFDFQSLTDLWQKTIAEIPLEELGDRLEQLSHETLSTIIKTNELFSESSLSQIQGIEDYIAQQIETIKIAAYQRSETLKQQTLQQVEATRKAIAAAVYWMFAITFTSALVSALAGFLATISTISRQ